MTADDITQRIQAALPDAEVAVQDLTGGGDHWQVAIVSAAFEGKTRIQQHKMVYDAVGEAMDGIQIHALAIKTYTPAQRPGVS